MYLNIGRITTDTVKLTAFEWIENKENGFDCIFVRTSLIYRFKPVWSSYFIESVILISGINNEFIQSEIFENIVVNF